MSESLTAENRYMTAAEAAAYLGVSQRTLTDWAQSGAFRYFMLGKRRRFLREDLDRWAKSRERKRKESKR